jgi:hypothetical protein
MDDVLWKLPQLFYFSCNNVESNYYIVYYVYHDGYKRLVIIHVYARMRIYVQVTSNRSFYGRTYVRKLLFRIKERKYVYVVRCEETAILASSSVNSAISFFNK